MVRAEENVLDAVAEVTDPRDADLVIEAVGKDVTRLQAFECVAEAGMVGLFEIDESYRR